MGKDGLGGVALAIGAAAVVGIGAFASYVGAKVHKKKVKYFLRVFSI